MKPCGAALLAQDAALLVNPSDLGRGHTKLWLVHMGKYAFLAWGSTASDAREVAQAWQPYSTVATWYIWRSLDPLPVEY